jgi:hypothetical protein
MEKAKIMEQRYGGNDSVSVGDGMSIFGGQSIDVRRRSKLRRRATHKVKLVLEDFILPNAVCLY